MNLDKASAGISGAPLAPPDWSMTMQKEGIQFTADIKRAGVLMCRFSVAWPDGDEAAARHALADKARYWIDDFLNRSAATIAADGGE